MMPDAPQTTEQGAVIVIDGTEHTLDELTFKEQRAVRTYVRQLNDDPSIEIGDVTLMDLLPALVTVIKQRTDPAYTLDQADEMKVGDVLQDRPAPPTAAAKATRSKGGRTGTRATS